ncbi:phosphatidylinositol alpha-mannosyltransferase [Actinopolymorpha cephalotaxi]|uniref:Phosphatidylinositol alpha-mannosyltransferase n=1 Tax=Actinopolymorpha cephalotaxi TaxID=504797 RepID=A0A1I2PZG1_9ACTN|nr:glycosyltransferase family 4 protein [Actinopolymorpha cephalotaxi]NYH83491.1 phosphatidylinositol alpha-mannosyltransferase [Actinopolymorpha cephalotaxi]SFG19006.1 phosphatidylinositol alpha-mannosyltransferase [Actinopolymorpha cephalotaxi]
MRVGIVCPYSLDAPGGVQNHVRDLAEVLLAEGHAVSVLAPADDDTPVPPYVVPAGRAVPVPYNGSVARLAFGPVSAARVRRWIRDGQFDVLHIHEPATPSLSLLALWAAVGPIVGTFHTAMPRSRMMSVASSVLRPALEKISARIAVSEPARDTLVQHLGGEPVVIPNGLFVDRFARARPRPEWQGEDGTMCFLGRLDEPRKGLAVLLRAFPAIWRARPSVRLLVAGPGDVEEVRSGLPAECRDAVTFLGKIDDEGKADMFASSQVYVAPQTGGESFGIVLVEAMAAGAPVLASDLDAFRLVVDGGRLGRLFGVGDSDDLATGALELLGDAALRDRLREAARVAVRRYDWSAVAKEILSVYEMVAAGYPGVGEADDRSGGVRPGGKVR